MPSILFECVHNACRSQIAEAICRKLAPDWHAASAGSHPSVRVDPKAVEILAQNGLPLSRPKPKSLKDVPSIEWDYVVAMGCPDKCRSTLRAKDFLRWDIPDPEDGPMELYQALYDDLAERIARLTGKAVMDDRDPLETRKEHE